MSHGVDIAVVGAASLAGELIIAELQQSDLPVHHLYPVDETEGSIEFAEQEVHFIEPAGFDFERADLVIFAEAGQALEASYEAARIAGCRVVNATGQYLPDAPWALAELLDADQFAVHDALSSPTPVATILALLLAPLQRAFGPLDIDVTVLQAVSDAGKAGVEELAEQTRALLTFRTPVTSVFEQRIAFNVVPRSCTDEEISLWRQQLAELAEVPADSLHLQVLWVPVFYGHGMLLRLRLPEVVSAEQVREALLERDWITLDAAGAAPGSPALTAAGSDDVRVNLLPASGANDIHLWMVADGQRRGLAAEAVKLASLLVKK
ncbi:MAG: hypothetical protein KDH88_05300 [Chromatiales bacterium]|nr:hypothetical protein [Chromatiales bacterium]